MMKHTMESTKEYVGLTIGEKVNQAIIENLLDMWLSTKQLKAIEDGWKAFYNDPLKYKGTVVIDMVKQDLAN